MSLKRTSFLIAICFIGTVFLAGLYYAVKSPSLDISLSGERTSPAASNFPWIQRGRFGFCRLDGGPLEVDKGVIAGWPYLNDPLNRAIMADLYTRYAERILDVMQQMQINWVWVTWSNGFSLQKEAQQWDLCRAFIAKCHSRGIWVTAYLSMGNIFWENMFADMPESREWVRYDFWGNPVLFGNVNKRRYFANLKQDGWQSLMLTRVRGAIDAGADALYFDNIHGKDGAEAVAVLLQIRALTIKLRGPQGIPLYCNAKWIRPINQVSDLSLGEGSREPGIIEGRLVTNIAELKKYRSRRPPGMTYVYEHSYNAQGPRRESLMSPEGYKISMAEAAAFQASYYIAPQGVTLKELIDGTPTGRALIDTIGRYNKFFLAHKDLYTGTEPVGDSTESWFWTVALKKAAPGVVASLDKKPDGSLYVLHLLNYAREPAKNTSVSFRAGVLPELLAVKTFSPDSGETAEATVISLAGAGVTIQVPLVDTCTVLALVPGHKGTEIRE